MGAQIQRAHVRPAAAQGREHEVVDDNLPKLVSVKSNKPGKLPNEQHPYLGGKEAIGQMTIAEDMEVNLFAPEEMFPEIVNPVQMAVDTDGRLFVSVWASYPHWNPTEPRTDRIVCLPDENADGVADECIIFADELNSVTGFEFWGGGMLVAAPPEIWFLQDTDGDDVADKKIRMLQGVSSADTHHSANAVVMGPDGWLYWSRGIFNVAAILGTAAVVRPLAIPPDVLTRELPVVVAMSLLLFPVLRTRWRIRRWEGALLLTSYVGALVWPL